MVIPNRNVAGRGLGGWVVGWAAAEGISCEPDSHVTSSARHSRCHVRVVVVMRILPQPFTSFGCHGYTAGGPELLDTEAGTEGGREGGMLGSTAFRLAALLLFPCVN